MRWLNVLLILSACASWAQSEPPAPPAFPVDTPPPVVRSCTTARDCNRQRGEVCELPGGPGSRGVCSLGPPSTAKRCSIDADCGSPNHCSEHKLILEDRNANWFGICLEGERTPADGPAPQMHSGPLPMRFEYSGQVPPGFVLLARPDTGFLVPGLVLLAGSYAGAQLYYLFPNWSAWSLIPFAGPLIQFFTSQGTITTGTEGHFGIALAFTGAQLLGAAGIVIGIVKPIRWLERSSVAIVPSPGGVAMLGTF